jgi:O-antigen ligase
VNWQAIKQLRHEQVGAFFALLIVVLHPFFGPRAPSVLLMLLGMWLIFRERRQLFQAPAQRRWVIVFLLLFVPVLLSVPGSFDLKQSLGVASALFLYFFAGLALLRSLRGERERYWLAKWTGIVLLFWVADSAFQYFAGKDLFGIPLTSDGRISGPYSTHIFMPVLLVYLTPLLLWVLMPRSLALAALAFLATALVSMMSGARTVLVWIPVAATGFLMRWPHSRWKWPVAGFAVLLLVLAVPLSPALQGRLGHFAELRAPSFETIDRVLSQRLTIWHTASNMLVDRPLTGVGAGGFAAAYNQYATLRDDMFRDRGVKVYHAHQLYVGLAAETGLIGLLAFFVVIGLCLHWYWRAPPARRDQAWPYALGLVIYAFPINSQSVLYTHRLFPVLLLLLAGMLAALDESTPAGDAAAQA